MLVTAGLLALALLPTTRLNLVAVSLTSELACSPAPTHPPGRNERGEGSGPGTWGHGVVVMMMYLADDTEGTQQLFGGGP